MIPPSDSSLPSIPPQKPGTGRWVLLGCGGCLGIILLGLIGFAAIFYFAIGVIKKTDVYDDAIKSAQSSEAVQAVLGTPIKAGWMPQGSVNYDNGSGSADLNIPLSGPKGAATLIIKATKSSNAPWEYSTLEVQGPGEGKIDLRK